MQLTLYKSINYFRYEGIIVNAEEVVRTCSSKTLFLKTCNIHRKGPLLKDFPIKRHFQTEAFSCEYCKTFIISVFLQNTSGGCFCQSLKFALFLCG